MRHFLLVFAAIFGCSTLTSFEPLASESQAQCEDGIDNDGDGPSDCADSDCAALLACQTPPFCGDGLVNGEEECDLDNLKGQNCLALGFVGGVLACANDCSFDTSACIAAGCGNNLLDAGETCDDGNSTVGDGCNANCQFEFCGDGILNNNNSELCDDGNTTAGDGCNSICEVEFCGDGILNNVFEQCDDGNLLQGDGCNALCNVEFCGDGIVNNGSSEQCDDGNNQDGDGCDSVCVSEFCGDGAVNNGSSEQCDDGNFLQGDGCNALCNVEFCGDGIVNNSSSEQCDDGNLLNDDGCDAFCAVEFCGDGVVNNGTEECDDGTPQDGDGCNSICAVEFCGDGIVNNVLEECDDENVVEGDGCDAACVVEPLRGVQLATGGFHTCARLNNGAVRCWGLSTFGQLGYGNTNNIGDNESLASAGDVNVGGIVVQLAAGREHTCALLDTGNVRCWGRGNEGQLGYGNGTDVGDNESPASAGDVNVGGTVIQLAPGHFHTCALLDTGNVRCWGLGLDGRLGYGNTNKIGDNESPASAGDVNVGGTVIQLAAGLEHTCALLNTGKVRCWGRGFDGRLGYGNTTFIGDDESPASAGDVNVGGTVLQLAAGGFHTCALLDTGNVRCWGRGFDGQLGYGNGTNVGDDESPASAGDVNVGGTVLQLAAVGFHTCALLDTGNVRCWGEGSFGRLGYGNANRIGDNESPASAGDVNVGGTVLQLAAGDGHTCALLDTGNIRCWGTGVHGQLGYGNTNNIGDNESPASAGDVPVF